MKTIITILMTLVGFNAIAQTALYTVSKDTKTDGLVFNGLVTFEDLNKEPSFTWLKKGYEAYKPDLEKTNYLASNFSNFKMVVFLGTWCDDSHELLPKLEKVLAMTNYQQDRLTMYGVDREKTTTNGENKKYNITLVPTIILFNSEGKEVGRITETVNKSVEEDLATFISMTIRGGYRSTTKGEK